MVTGEAGDGAARAGDGAAGAVAPEGGYAGERIVRVAAWATAVFAALSTAAAVAPEPLEYLAVPVDVALFLAGSGAFLWAYAVAVARSRYEAVTMGGVFFLTGEVAPRRVVRALRWALAVQVVVAIAVASVRPFTALAAGVLVPVFGLGSMALWGARHGRFPARVPNG